MNPPAKQQIIRDIQRTMQAILTGTVTYIAGMDQLQRYASKVSQLQATDVQAYIDHGQALTLMLGGQPYQAERQMHHAATIYQLHENYPRALLALTEAANFCRLMGNHRTATLYIADALQLADNHPQLDNNEGELTRLYVVYGLLRMDIGDLNQGMQLLRRGIIEYYTDNQEYTTSAVQSWCAQAVIYALWDEPDAAWQVWALARQQIENTPYPVWSAYVWFTAALLSEKFPRADYPQPASLHALDEQFATMPPGLAFWHLVYAAPYWQRFGANAQALRNTQRCRAIALRLKTPALHDIIDQLHARRG